MNLTFKGRKTEKTGKGRMKRVGGTRNKHRYGGGLGNIHANFCQKHALAREGYWPLTLAEIPMPCTLSKVSLTPYFSMYMKYYQRANHQEYFERERTCAHTNMKTCAHTQTCLHT